MAEGYANSPYNWSNMNWAAADLSKEWERFYQHCEFTFGLQVMAGEDPRVAVNTVTSKPGPPKRLINQKKYKQPPEIGDQQQKRGKCGYRAHKLQEKCPAKNEHRNKCNKLEHFAQVCRSQKNRGSSTLRCRLDTGTHANVINISQLQQVAPNAQIKKTKQILVSFSQHRMTPRDYTTLPVRFKDRESWVKFYVIDSKQNPILSGEACQALSCTPSKDRG